MDQDLIIECREWLIRNNISFKENFDLSFRSWIKAGGKILASTNQIDAHENGVVQQTVLIEFESFEKARLAYNSPEYQEALKALDGGADRDIRIFEGK